MKNITKFLIPLTISFAALLIFIVPNVSFAQCVETGCSTAEDAVEKTVVPECTGQAGEDISKCCPTYTKDEALVQCGRKIKCQYQAKKLPNGNWNVDETKPVTKIADPEDACNFNALISLINRIINYILFYLAIPIAAIMFVYAGILLLFSGGDSGARTKAKDFFLNAVKGLVLAFAAFLIIKLLFSILGYSGASWIGF